MYKNKSMSESHTSRSIEFVMDANNIYYVKTKGFRKKKIILCAMIFAGVLNFLLLDFLSIVTSEFSFFHSNSKHDIRESPIKFNNHEIVIKQVDRDSCYSSRSSKSICSKRKQKSTSLDMTKITKEAGNCKIIKERMVM